MSDLNQLAADLIAAKERKAEADEAAKIAGRECEAAEVALFEAMIEAELSKITANGYTFSPDLKDYFNVPAEQIDAFHDVMVELGRGGIFKFTAHAQTRDATLRELIAERGGELPAELEGIVGVFNKQRVNMRKSTAKG